MRDAVGVPARDVRRNGRLGDLLDELGWSRAQTASLINERARKLGHRQINVHRSRVASWVNRGVSPRHPVGDILAVLISDATGVRHTAADLGLAAHRIAAVPADLGLHVSWDPVGLDRVLEDWPIYMINRRRFLALTGAAMTDPAWHAVTTPNRSTGGGAWPTRPQPSDPAVSKLEIDLVEQIVTHSQQLDERHGTAGYDFVRDQFDVVRRLVRTGQYRGTAYRRMTAALAQLAQTLGFMAAERCENGEAQRWYLIALRAAHLADDHGIQASILALTSNLSITMNQPSDAQELALASLVAARNTPPQVRALITARAGLAAANNGDLAGFQRARDRALTAHLDAARTDSEAPHWSRYATLSELDALAGRGLVLLATRIPAQQEHLLEQAQQLLTPRAFTAASSTSQRSALRHGALLALAHTRSGNVEQAVAAADRALDRLPTVTSHRVNLLFARLCDELSPHACRWPAAGDAVTGLRRALT